MEQTYLPFVQHQIRREGQLILSPGSLLIVEAPKTLLSDPRLRCAGRLIQQVMECVAGYGLQTFYVVDRNCVSNRSEQPQLLLQVAGDGDSEAYRIEISPESKRIEIFAQAPRGALWAMRTLEQHMQQKGLVFEGGTIEDAPTLPWRGFYHDVTRGRVPTLESLKRLAEALSRYKLNELQLYIEHTYLFSNESEVWRDDTPLTAADIQELDRYCDERGVELVPSVSSFGHLYELLRSYQFCGECELDVDPSETFSYIGRMAHHTADIHGEAVFEQILRRIDEFSGLCRTRRFNICADETFDLGQGKNRDLCANQGRGRLYVDFLKRLQQHLNARGLEMQFWGDIIIDTPDLYQEFDPKPVCLTWDYAAEGSDHGVKTLAKLGARQYLCPGVGTWNMKLPSIFNAYRNIHRMTTYAIEYGAEGVLNTDWGDFAHICDPCLSLPGLIHGACVAWTGSEALQKYVQALHPAAKDEPFDPAPSSPQRLLEYELLNAQISKLECGDFEGSYVSDLNLAQEEDLFPWFHMVRLHEAETMSDRETAERWLVEGKALLEKNMGPDRYAAAQAKLQQIKAKLLSKPLLCARPEEATSFREAAINGLDFILCTNELGYLYWQSQLDLEVSTLASLKPQVEACCQRLEHWMLRYRKRWLKVSQTSELSRMTEVLSAWLDRLRRKAYFSD